MSPETLPYALLLLLGEFAAGCMLVLSVLGMRQTVPLGYLKVSAAMVLTAAGLTLALALALPAVGQVGGYVLDAGWFLPLRLALVFFTVASLAHNLALYRGSDALQRPLALLSAVAGAAMLALAGALFAPPTWGYPGTVLSLLAGSLSVGTVSLGMVLGHWYLVNPRLSEKPLSSLTLALLAALIFQVVTVVLNAALPAREAPIVQTAIGLGLAANPAFWLRVGVGLLFPIVLGYMAWESSRLRGMMSATGLLYIAMGAVLAGEALARGLLFATAAPV